MVKMGLRVLRRVVAKPKLGERVELQARVELCILRVPFRP